MQPRSLSPVLFAAGLALAASGASAQTLAQALAVRSACMASAQALCPEAAAAHDRQAAKACLLKNLDKVSPDCRAAIRDAGLDKPSSGHGN